MAKIISNLLFFSASISVLLPEVFAEISLEIGVDMISVELKTVVFEKINSNDTDTFLSVVLCLWLQRYHSSDHWVDWIVRAEHAIRGNVGSVEDHDTAE
jgi:hypothetical protein